MQNNGENCLTKLKLGHNSFTLIELLITIALLAVLTGLLLPSFSLVRKSGSRVACSNNLVQLGKSLEMYTQDNKEYIPYHCTSQKKTDYERLPLNEAILQYAKNNLLFQCPNDYENLYGNEGSSYIWNWLQLEIPGNEKSGRPQYLASPFGMVRASAFPVLVDGSAYHGAKGDKRSFNVLFADWSVNTALEIGFN